MFILKILQDKRSDTEHEIELPGLDVMFHKNENCQLKQRCFQKCDLPFYIMGHYIPVSVMDLLEFTIALLWTVHPKPVEVRMREEMAFTHVVYL